MKRIVNMAMIFMLALFVLPSYAFGDFFSTITQRQLIDAMRERGVVSLVQETQEPDTIKMNGFYYKGHDKKNEGVIWVNGKQLGQEETKHGVTINKLSEKDKTAYLSIGESVRPLPLRPGQKVYLDEYEVVDAYQ